MKKISYKKEDIKQVAMEITCDSDTYGDEVLSVIAKLGELSDSANRFGCKMEEKISDMWGGSVLVCALPDHYNHSWLF